MNKPTEKPGCESCYRTGHTWDDGTGKRICFECMRQQRLQYRDQCERQAEVIRALREQEGSGYQQALQDCYHILEDARARIRAQLGGEP